MHLYLRWEDALVLSCSRLNRLCDMSSTVKGRNMIVTDSWLFILIVFVFVSTATAAAAAVVLVFKTPTSMPFLSSKYSDYLRRNSGKTLELWSCRSASRSRILATWRRVLGYLPSNFPSQGILNSSSYLPHSPTIHKRIEKGINEYNSRNDVIGNLHGSCISSKCLHKHYHTEWKIENQEQTVNIKYSHSRFSTLQQVPGGVKIHAGPILVVYLALVSSNNPKNLESAHGGNNECHK